MEGQRLVFEVSACFRGAGRAQREATKLSCKTLAAHMNGLTALFQVKMKDVGSTLVCKEMLADIRRLSKGDHPFMTALASTRVGRELLTCVETSENIWNSLSS